MVLEAHATEHATVVAPAVKVEKRLERLLVARLHVAYHRVELDERRTELLSELKAHGIDVEAVHAVDDFALRLADVLERAAHVAVCSEVVLHDYRIDPSLDIKVELALRTLEDFIRGLSLKVQHRHNGLSLFEHRKEAFGVHHLNHLLVRHGRVLRSTAHGAPRPSAIARQQACS